MSEPTDLQIEIITRLSRMEGKLDTWSPLLADHEKRIRDVETLQSNQKGWAAGVSAVVSVVITAGIAYFFK